MKRYYLERLGIFQTIIKAVFINIFISIPVALLLFLIGIKEFNIYVYVLGIIYIVVFVRTVYYSRRRISFYIKEKQIVYCIGNREEIIEIDLLELVEEFFGIDYVFGMKTIILHTKERKYNFLFKKDKANKFKNIILDVVNNGVELGEIDL